MTERTTGAPRILTTHAGSLPRPRELIELFIQLSRRAPVDGQLLAQAVDAATRRAVSAQLEAGIDIGNNGEQARESFFTYVQHRMSGFGGESPRPLMRDLVHYPSFVERKLPEFSRAMVSLMNAPKAVAPVRYSDVSFVESECSEFRRIVNECGGGFTDTFMSAASPGIIAAAMLNEHYANEGAYVDALAEALRVEYQAIVRHGFILQIDCPDLAMERHTSYADRPLREFIAFIDRNIAALNRAIAGLPRERIRMHVCWGNYEGPHVFDVPLDDILPHLYAAEVGALLLPFANSRHAHEHRCFRRHPLPAGLVLIAGVIDPTTNYVEHPEVVAERIERIAAAVGAPERVMAGTDCGFDTAAGLGTVADEVVWEKLRALGAGAQIATQRLFGTGASAPGA